MLKTTDSYRYDGKFIFEITKSLKRYSETTFCFVFYYKYFIIIDYHYWQFHFKDVLVALCVAPPVRVFQRGVGWWEIKQCLVPHVCWCFLWQGHCPPPAPALNLYICPLVLYAPAYIFTYVFLSLRHVHYYFIRKLLSLWIVVNSV